MKKFTRILSFLSFFFLMNTAQAVPMAVVNPTAPSMEDVTLEDLSNLSREEIETQIGRKLDLSERMALSVLKRKAKRAAKKAGLEYDDSEKTDGFAIAALVCGILGFLSVGLLSILAIIFGSISKKRIQRDPSLEGYGMAQAGFILGIVALALAVLVIILAVSIGLVFI